MRLKDSTVNLEGVQWQMFKAAIVAERIWASFGAELVITSANDGKHLPHSFHYKGLALDLRTYNLHGRERMAAQELAIALGEEYDVVLEKDHIHLEHDPK